MLLVPLNFLVMAGLSEAERQAEPGLRIATEMLALAVFAGLMQPAARALLKQGRFALIVAVLGISARTADRYWAYGRAWLYKELREVQAAPPA